MARTTRTTQSFEAAAAAPTLIRWGAVLAGAVVGVALLVLLTALWFALAYGSDINAIRTNLDWYVAGSAVLSMFLGGMISGWLSGVPGIGPGFFHGLAVWALALIVSLVVGVPSLIGATGLEVSVAETLTAGDLFANGTGLWAGFLSLAIGALTAALGGMFGGALSRPAFPPTTETIVEEHDRPMRQAVVRRDDMDDDQEYVRTRPMTEPERAYDLEDERSYDRGTIPAEEARPSNRPVAEPPAHAQPRRDEKSAADRDDGDWSTTS